MVTIKDSKILIVEDAKDLRELYVKFLIDNDISEENLKSVCCSKQAMEEIRDFIPDLVLLDVKIPYTEDGVPDSGHSKQVIDRIESHNTRFEKKIKTIIISATTEDKGIQDLVSIDPLRIFKMMDKNLLATSPEKFKVELKKHIDNALNASMAFSKPTISVVSNFRNILVPLKVGDTELYNYMFSEIFNPFEEINSKTEGIISHSIIIRCGMVVEDIIDLLSKVEIPKQRKLSIFSNIRAGISLPMEDEGSVRDKLNLLSGRKWSEGGINENLGTPKITRQAYEYAHFAFRCRNQASHSSKSDYKNNNMFSDNIFTKEHALSSITLIMPLVQDYIKLKTQSIS